MRRNGITLLELAIVLMIIGLLVGGVVIGKTVIREGEIRNAIGELNLYVKAIQEFQDKYAALPGDMSNAETIWGTDPGGCPNTPHNTVAKQETCNGNGKGTIGDSSSNSILTSTTEWWRAWQQLSNANLIKGKFTGARGLNSAGEAEVGVNAPASDMTDSGWTLLYYQSAVDGDLYADVYGHLLALGAKRTNDFTRNPSMSPAEAISVDQKLDDGKPGTGKLRAWRTSLLSNCTVNDGSQATQAYNGAYDEWACSIIFLLGF